MKKILLLIIPIILIFSGCIVTTRDAEHVAYITSIEQNGVFFKGYNVYTKTDLSASNEDMFCVEDKSVLNELKSARDKQEKVK